MPDGRRRTCRACGKHEREVGSISWRGKCSSCSYMLQVSNAVALHTKHGPEFVRWRRAMAASVGGVLLDDLNERP